MWLCFYVIKVFRKKVNIVNSSLVRWNILSSFMTIIWHCKCLLQLNDDIELNLGPKLSSCKSFSICQWNLNSITSYNFIRASLLTAYNSIHKFDIIYLSETHLNPKHFQMTKIWLTICQTTSVGEFASTSRNHYH